MQRGYLPEERLHQAQVGPAISLPTHETRLLTDGYQTAFIDIFPGYLRS